MVKTSEYNVLWTGHLENSFCLKDSISPLKVFVCLLFKAFEESYITFTSILAEQTILSDNCYSI